MTRQTIKVGCRANVIETPLFTELYGYGPFLGRRNRGVLDPLYCRCASFYDGRKRIIIISNDLVTMDPGRVGEVRARVSRQTGVPPGHIMVCGSHTHSGPTISPGVGWGELNPVFASGWVRTAVKTAVAAVRDESPVMMTCGSARLKAVIGYNRVWPDGPTDPEIRWAAFSSTPQDLKLLIHNHGMHGVVFGPPMLLVSADWPGAVNQALQEQKIARHVMFLQGAAGDINAKAPCCLPLEEGIAARKEIAGIYVQSLVAGLDAGRPCAASPIRVALEKTTLPSDPVTPDYLRAMAPRVREKGAVYQADRMEEMALYMEAGGGVAIDTELQVLRVGELLIYALGGEPFYEIGRTLIDHAPTRATMVASIANDNLRYLPTPRAFAENADLAAATPRSGYYETQFAGFGRFRAKYRADVGPFLIRHYKSLARSITR